MKCHAHTSSLKIIALLVIAVVAPPTMGQELEWTSIQPPSRISAALTYDSVRGTCILVGGYGTGSVSLNDTWEFNGSRWDRRSAGGQPRGPVEMAFDPSRGEAIVFGGGEWWTPGAMGETWTWNGNDWTQRAVVGPLARHSHAVAFDTNRNVLVLFGGHNNTTENAETWEWNGVEWIFRPVTGPSSRSEHSMVFDTARNVTVLFGGLRITESLGDLWEWNGTSWLRRHVIGPPARFGHAASYDEHRHVMVIVGGSDASTWEWNGTFWSRPVLNSPPSPGPMAMTYDAARGVSVLLRTHQGGLVTAYSTETWEWNGSSWSLVIPAPPEPRYSHSMTFDTARQEVLLTGGALSIFQGAIYSDTWTLGDDGWTERSIDGPARYFASMAYDEVRNNAVLFGGSTAATETWIWNGTDWSSRSVSGPQPRNGASMVYDATRQKIVLFGGRSGSTSNFTETWLWDGAQWMQAGVTGPSARVASAMAFDSFRSEVVLFGGFVTGVGRLSDTWIWNGSTWSRREVAAPPPRSSHAMAFDIELRKTVLFGGFNNGTALSDSWLWDGTTWTELAGQGPSARSDHAMTYDPNRKAVLLTCGALVGLTPNDETWLLSTPCVETAVIEHPASASTCRGGSISFSVAMSGPGPHTYRWRKNGVALSHAENSTVLTDTLHFSYALPADAGRYDCVVSSACNRVVSQPAALLVCAPDFDCNGLIDFADYLEFVSAFSIEDIRADFNADYVIDFFDYLDFVESLSAGC